MTCAFGGMLTTGVEHDNVNRLWIFPFVPFYELRIPFQVHYFVSKFHLSLFQMVLLGHVFILGQDFTGCML